MTPAEDTIRSKIMTLEKAISRLIRMKTEFVKLKDMAPAAFPLIVEAFNDFQEAAVTLEADVTANPNLPAHIKRAYDGVMEGYALLVISMQAFDAEMQKWSSEVLTARGGPPQ